MLEDSKYRLFLELLSEMRSFYRCSKCKSDVELYKLLCMDPEVTRKLSDVLMNFRKSEDMEKNK